ncbi:MAG: biopolymer transport protein ExbD [Leptospiraceae bacterium]|nr:MAG: biopolymer transport protein ExbD [Leptospiraceae bacterium]
MIQFKKVKQNSFRIDITPLIDVVFLIIVFLILTLGKIHSFLNIELPKLEESFVSTNSNIPVLSIQRLSNEHYNILWNKKPIEMIEIESYIKREKPDKIILKCDKDIPYGFFMMILSKIQKNQNIELMLEYEMDKN